MLEPVALRLPAAMLLDFDGTLFETENSVRAGVQAAGSIAQGHVDVTEDGWVSANREAARRIWPVNFAAAPLRREVCNCASL